MQIAQEAKLHAADMRKMTASFKNAKLPKWLVLSLVILAFAGGWLGGSYRGLIDGAELGEFSRAGLSSMVAKEVAAGNGFLVEKYHAQSIDNLVRNHVDAANASIAQKGWKMLSPAYWITRGGEQRNHDAIVRLAERRIALVPTPKPETLAELAMMGRSDQLAMASQKLEDVAAKYSTLLGREIRAEQLVPDAYLREFIIVNRPANR